MRKRAFKTDPRGKFPMKKKIEGQLTTWLKETTGDAKSHAESLKAWNDKKSGDILTRLMAAVAVQDKRVSQLIDSCNKASEIGPLPHFAWLSKKTLTDEKTDGKKPTDKKDSLFLTNNAKLYFGRWLAQEGYFDESLTMLDGISIDDVADPAAMLFYQSVANHNLINVKEGMESVAKLMEQKPNLPIRYRQLAMLMERDLTGVKEDSLDHIARQMNDIQRRLHKGRAGERVIEEEEKVVDALDIIIEKLEEEQRKKQQQQGSGQGNQPMQDSRPSQMKGPGRVDRKDIGQRSGWGDLPEKEREKAMQEISRDFPSHYREVIEQYFRKLATDTEDKKP